MKYQVGDILKFYRYLNDNEKVDGICIVLDCWAKNEVGDRAYYNVEWLYSHGFVADRYNSRSLMIRVHDTEADNGWSKLS